MQLAAGAIAGIAIGAAVFAGLLGFVVSRGLAANKGRDADKSAQLAYMNEMTEADIAAEEEEEDEEARQVRLWFVLLAVCKESLAVKTLCHNL